MQLLSGHSCSYACRYCYIQDWYAFVQPAPTELSGTEVLLALLYNSNWIPSRDFIILGDVCDPFHQNLQVRTMEYIRAVAVLGSPIQFSTKSFITKALCAQLAQWSVAHQCPINGLVTCTTLRHVQQLEPEAPPVEQRMETIRNLRRGTSGRWVKPAGFQAFELEARKIPQEVRPNPGIWRVCG